MAGELGMRSQGRADGKPRIAQHHLAVLLAVGAVVTFLALLAWSMVRSDSGPSAFGVNSVGEVAHISQRPAVDLRLSLFDSANTPWRLSDQRGKKVVVNFWASWCPPCRSEASTLATAARDYASRNIVLVGVDVWDDVQSARAFIREFDIRYPNGRDEAGTAAVDYGVAGIPETFVVDAKGSITARWVGPLTREALDKLVGVQSR